VQRSATADLISLRVRGQRFEAACRLFFVKIFRFVDNFLDLVHLGCIGIPLRGPADVPARRLRAPSRSGLDLYARNSLSFWKGKLLILCLLGFVATGWLVTITLSAADATAPIVENPFTPQFLHGQHIVITLVLLATLGAVFLKGFKEAIGIAVAVVGAYLLLNLVVVAVGLYECVVYPTNIADWRSKLFANCGNPLTMLGVSLLVFPRLDLGLSGFETGVSMMPLVRGDRDDGPQRPAGRIRNTHKMLTVAAIIMSFYLITTSFVTAVLIPAAEFQPGGSANGRALAYLAHDQLGEAFGTVYDLSTSPRCTRPGVSNKVRRSLEGSGTEGG
jgi:hypothetical protein